MLLLLVANFELKHDSGSVLRGGRVFVLNCAVCVSVIFFFWSVWKCVCTET